MSLKLPGHLSPWENQLQIFPDEIALALGPLLQRIAALVGNFPHHHAEGHAFPDGFAGLAKRGSYERLVASDWMLADELPEEFMRRSVMGEHLFWKLAYREPSQSRRTLVLFDAGPEQLGSPRILHLAALVVMEARARRAKAKFNWGILQHPEANLMPGMNVAEVETLLRARGGLSATAEDFAAWSRRFAGEESPGERWVVGSERLRGFLPPEFSSLLIGDLPPPDAGKLRAESRPSGKHPRSIEINLPSSRACVQLLRDPFSISTAPQQKIESVEPVSNLLLSPASNKLWMKTEQGNLLSVGVPNSPRQVARPVKKHETLKSSPPVAIGRAGSSTMLVSLDPVCFSFRVRRFGGAPVGGLEDGDYELIKGQTRPLFLDNCLSACVWHNVLDRKPGLYILDDSGLLLRLFTDSAGRSCEVVNRHALALTRCRLGLCYLAFDSESATVRVSIADHEPAQFWRSEIAPERAFFGFGPAEETAVYGQVALGYSKTHWTIHTLKGSMDVSVPNDFSVHGVVQERNYETALVVVEGDGCTLSLHGAHGTRRLVRAGAPIVNVTVGASKPCIAWSTTKGDISVFSLNHRAEVLSLTGSKK